MDKGKFRKLNRFHVVFLVQNVMVHYGLFAFPYFARGLGNTAWLIPVAFGILITFLLFPMVKLCEKFPSENLFQINEKLLSKPIGKVINLLIVGYGVLIVSNVSSQYLRLVQAISLNERTLTVPAIAFYIVLITFVLGGIKLIARFSIFSFFMTGWMVYFLVWPLSKGIWINAVSDLNFQMLDWTLSLHESVLAVLGFELILFYYPYIMNKKKAYKDAVIGVWIALFFFFAVTFASVVYFSVWQLENVIYPVLNIYKAVELSFLERIENFGLSLWVFLIFSTCSAYLWMAKRGLDSILSKNQNRNWHLYVLAALSLFLYLGPIPYQLQQYLFETVSVYFAYVLLLWPIFLLFVSFFRQPRREKYEQKQM